MPSSNHMRYVHMRYVLCRIFPFLAAFIAFGGTAQAQMPGPAGFAGVLTRWQTSTGTGCEQSYQNDADQASCPRSLMFTITPDLAGLGLYAWAGMLAGAGVNTGVIFVVPSYDLLTTPVIDDATWTEYNQDIYLAQNSLTDSQKKIILQVGEAISKNQYTVAQRNDAIVTFLSQMQALFPNSKPIRFILDNRTWFISHLNSDGEPVPLGLTKQFSLERASAADISGVIQAAAAQGLDSWLSGVRLSEYASKNWNLMGPTMIDLVTEINSATSGWLQTHSFIGAGGGWGQDFKGINNMTCPVTSGWQFTPCTGTFPFFQLMARQVGYFAFGDKFMEYGKKQQYTLNGQPSGEKYVYITGEMADFCAKNTAGYQCDNAVTPSVKDWQVFLEDDVDGLGFADLISFLSANAAAYPQLANVIFDGDDADSLVLMQAGSSVNAPMALSSLFTHAMAGEYENFETGETTDGLMLGSWTGKIFVDGTDDFSTVPRPKFFADSGYSLFDVKYNEFTFAPATQVVLSRQVTQAEWSSWPEWP